MLLLKAGDMWAFVTNHETSLPNQREIIDEFRCLSAQRIVYNSKKNTMIASNLICHPGRQMKYPSTLFSINPRCVSCLKPHARFHTKYWGRGLLLALDSRLLNSDISRHKNKNPIRIIWRCLGCLLANSWAIPSPSSFISYSHWTHLPTPLALGTHFSPGAADTCYWVQHTSGPQHTSGHTTEHTRSLHLYPSGRTLHWVKHQPAKN